ncbi:MAG: hypothetical protein IJX20_04270 [Alphaproteobacteria bacterium]|nr:hypothetical protein [Alphaproteobacteria bacterium]
MQKKQEVALKNATSLQSGWQDGSDQERKPAKLYCVLVNHRSEILAMKEQVQMIRGLLAA